MNSVSNQTLILSHTSLTLNSAKFVLQPRNVNNKTDVPFAHPIQAG